MNQRLLITTAIGLLLGTGAFAQSPSDSKTNSPPAAQNPTNSNTPSGSAASSKSSSQTSTSSQSSTPSAQNAQSTPSETSKSGTTTSQSGSNATDPRTQTQSNQASPSQSRPSNENSPATTPSQAQSTQPSNSSNQAQTNPPPATNNQSQASPAGTGINTNSNAGAQPSTNTAAQPSNSQTNTAQSLSSNINVSANLNESQRTRVSESIARLNVAPLNNVNFSLSVGTAVPRDVRFQPLPADIVEVMPQYRGYDFFVVRDDIVIVEPSTYKIVDVVPRAGRSTVAAPAATSHSATFSERDREVIRKHARVRTEPRTEQRTTGSVSSTRVRVGDRLPDSVEIRPFPDEAYQEAPALREYRYIQRDNRTYLVEPHERTIIEEID